MKTYQRISHYLDANKPIGILVLRAFIGMRLIYGVADNVLSWDRMLEFAQFLNTNGFFLPLASAIVSVYAQLLCALAILFGYMTRLASIILVINFLVALIGFHFRIHDTIEGMTPALAMLFGCLTLFFTGADKWSVDYKLRRTLN